MAQKAEDSAYRIPSSLWIPWLPNARSIKKSRSILTSRGDNPHLDWYSLVEEYTNRELSYAADKLPALSGLAHKFAQATDDVYLAGLWKRRSAARHYVEAQYQDIHETAFYISGTVLVVGCVGRGSEMEQ
jgi:hypothetical protein